MKEIIKISLLICILSVAHSAKEEAPLYTDGDLNKIVNILQKFYQEYGVAFGTEGVSTKPEFIKIQNRWLKNAQEECRFIHNDIGSGSSRLAYWQSCMESKKKYRFMFLYHYHLKLYRVLYAQNNPWEKSTTIQKNTIRHKKQSSLPADTSPEVHTEKQSRP